MAVPRVRIRPLRRFEEFEPLVGIQKAVWGHDDLDVTPVHQFCASARAGAILFGAYVDGVLAGFVYSFPAEFEGRRSQHSHLLAVLPEYQGFGLGKALKLAQREEALRRGYDLITWTYDPLMTRNANLNLQALGAFTRTYLPNFYGMTEALCLAPGVPTDRLLIEWRIRAAGVEKRAAAAGAVKAASGPRRGAAAEAAGAKGPGLEADALPKALERGRNGAEPPFAMPGGVRTSLRDPVVLVEVPRDVKALRERPEVIARWQTGLRRAMTHYFAKGYRAEHFLFGDRCFYVLRRGR